MLCVIQCTESENGATRTTTLWDLCGCGIVWAHRSPWCGMTAKQCAKCGTEQHPALFGQPRGWRAMIEDDTLCDMCRDDKEWLASFSCMPLSEQLVFAALIGDLNRVESLVGRGASLSTAHVAPTSIGDDGGCSLRLTPVAAAVRCSRKAVGGPRVCELQKYPRRAFGVGR